MLKDEFRAFFGVLLWLAIVTTCTILGALTTFSVGFFAGWALLGTTLPLSKVLNFFWATFVYLGGPVGFVIGVVWARGALRRD